MPCVDDPGHATHRLGYVSAATCRGRPMVEEPTRRVPHWAALDSVPVELDSFAMEFAVRFRGARAPSRYNYFSSSLASSCAVPRTRASSMADKPRAHFQRP